MQSVGETNFFSYLCIVKQQTNIMSQILENTIIVKAQDIPILQSLFENEETKQNLYELNEVYRNEEIGLFAFDSNGNCSADSVFFNGKFIPLICETRYLGEGYTETYQHDTKSNKFKISHFHCAYLLKKILVNDKNANIKEIQTKIRYTDQ